MVSASLQLHIRAILHLYHHSSPVNFTQGSPESLLADTSSQFHGMAKAAGILENHHLQDGWQSVWLALVLIDQFLDRLINLGIDCSKSIIAWILILLENTCVIHIWYTRISCMELWISSSKSFLSTVPYCEWKLKCVVICWYGHIFFYFNKNGWFDIKESKFLTPRKPFKSNKNCRFWFRGGGVGWGVRSFLAMTK